MATPPIQLTLNNIQFNFVPLAEADFSDMAAIYAIIGVNQDRTWKLLDIGQSGQLGSRIDSHDRRADWQAAWPHGNIWVGVHAMPTNVYSVVDRTRLESSLRTALNPYCGKR